jgi:hypothetical protein
MLESAGSGATTASQALFSCCHHDRLCHHVLASFSAPLPKRVVLNAYARRHVYVDLHPTVRQYNQLPVAANLSHVEDPLMEFCRRVAHMDVSLIGESNQHCWRLYEFSGHDSGAPELDEITTVISRVASFCCP